MPEATAGAASLAQIVHGQAVTPLVVNVHEAGVAIAWPSTSAPSSVAVKVVPAASGAVGANLAVRLGPSYDVVPATRAPWSSRTWNVIVAGSSDFEVVAVTVVDAITLVAPAAGACEVTTGAEASRVNTASTQ
jgi:hypothetical protein